MKQGLAPLHRCTWAHQLCVLTSISQRGAELPIELVRYRGSLTVWVARFAAHASENFQLSTVWPIPEGADVAEAESVARRRKWTADTGEPVPPPDWRRECPPNPHPRAFPAVPDVPENGPYPLGFRPTLFPLVPGHPMI